MDILPAENKVRLQKQTRMGSGNIAVTIEFGDTSLEMRKLPSQRKSLYFNELQDFDKYVKIDFVKRGAPGTELDK